MRRREFITLIAGAVAAWPLTARAEVQSAAKMYRVGFLLGATGELVASLFHALQDRLRELGYIEGRNVVFVQRYADGVFILLIITIAHVSS